jgi:hypothetical protein
VPAAHERRQDELDLVALAVDDGLDVRDEAVGDRARPREALFSEGCVVRLRQRRFHRRDAIHGRHQVVLRARG